IGSAKTQQRPRQGLEIVDHLDLAEPKLRGESASMKAPRAIGERNLVAVDRTGDREDRRCRPNSGVIEILPDRRLERRDGCIRHDDDLLRPLTGRSEREPAGAAADIGDQHRAGKFGGGLQHITHSTGDRKYQRRAPGHVPSSPGHPKALSFIWTSRRRPRVQCERNRPPPVRRHRSRLAKTPRRSPLWSPHWSKRREYGP